MSSSTRLIVKNLPKKITDEKLRTLFSGQGGRVTDVQLKYDKDGKFRHFAFVGFQTEEEATKAREYLDGNYVGAVKVKVEFCEALQNKPRSEKERIAELRKEKEAAAEKVAADGKKAKRNRKEEKRKKKEEAQRVLEKYRDDPKFQEFLRIHKRNSAGVWNDDAVIECGKDYSDQGPAKAEDGSDNDSDDAKENVTGDKEKSESDDESEDAEEVTVAHDQTVSDLDYLKSKKVSADESAEVKPIKKEKKKKEPKNVTFFVVKITGLPVKAKKKDLKQFFKPLSLKSVRVPRHVKGFAYVGFATEADRKKALLKHKSFVSGNQVFIKAFNSTEHGSGQLSEREQKWKTQEDALKSEETVGESGRLFIRNLSYTVTDDDIEALFKAFGPLSEVSVPIDNQTKRIKGFAFVTFMMPQHAQEAYTKLDGTSFQGRQLHLLPGKAKETDDNDGDGKSLSFKDQKAKKQKSQAGSSHNWNTLFLGASAVADVMAEKYDVSKGDVLTGDGKQSAAVRLALGETQIVAETRKFLEDEGIELDAFSRPPSGRSKTVMLVKNLPSKTPVEEIRNLFTKHGDLARVVLPPGGITAIVEFYEPSEAKKAFRGLAYTRFHNTPLYLEWAPDNAVKKAAVKPEVPVKETKEEVDDDEEPEEDTTIFVKNLNFNTLDEGLRRHFAAAGALHSASVATKRDAKRPGEVLSMGYGFVQFKRKSAADNCLKTLQRKVLDGHSLELKRSTRATTGSEEVKTAKKRTNIEGMDGKKASTKITVKNIAFEATEREVRDIFKTFGELKSVRLPKKVTGSHRGFAFVEFQSKAEAKTAFDALCQSTHLYGRRLVLEWAAEEETIEDLRRKTATHFADGAPTAKRVKKSQLEESVKMST